MPRVILLMLGLALILYALLDCVRTPQDSMPGKLPKILWILLILLIPPIGPIAWIIVSRVAAAEAKGGRIEPNLWSSSDGINLTFGKDKPAPAPQAPDDDPEFLEEVSRKLRAKQREEYELKKREQQDAQARGNPESQDRKPSSDEATEESSSDEAPPESPDAKPDQPDEA